MQGTTLGIAEALVGVQPLSRLSLIAKISELVANLSGLQTGVFRYLTDVLTPDMDVAGWLKFNEGEVQIIATLWELFSLIGVVLLIFHVSVKIAGIVSAQAGDVTIKSFITPLAEMTIGMILIIKGQDIVSWLLTLNNVLIDKAQALLSYENNLPSDLIDSLYRQVAGKGILECLGVFPTALLASLCGAGANLVMMYHAVSRKIEVLLRASFMPICIGDISSQRGEDSIGIRNLKKLGAFALYGIGMMLLISIGAYVQGSLLAGMGSEVDIGSLGSVLQFCLIPIAEAGMCGTVKQIVFEYLGA